MKKNQLHPRTEKINWKQKQKCRQAKQDALNWLSARFPKAFDTEVSIHALRIGIMKDILEYAAEAQQQGISKAKLRQAVVMFTRRVDYLACLKSKGSRINLFGEPIESVTEEEAKSAAIKIKKMIEKGIQRQKKQQSELASDSKTSGPKNDYLPLLMDEKETPTKKIEIIFKSKPSRKIDPEAVLRLKLKLGLNASEKEVLA